MEGSQDSLRVVGLFAGIGGLERGLTKAGHTSTLVCELDCAAQRVLSDRFPDVPLHDDIRTLSSLPQCDLLAAGFPCQDLSQAGRTAGITGERSGLVQEIFRLLDEADEVPRWVLLENVPFMLSLDRGAAMAWLTEELDSRGFHWAYRVVDSMAFGLPQRRRRVVLLASRDDDPRTILFGQDETPDIPQEHNGELGCGFYWTEGLRGLGWAVDAIPTLKGGSTIGIPSPPAIWEPGSESLVTPDIRDAERLQGFPANWTRRADESETRRRSDRWKLVGNAVSVPVAEWLGERLSRTSRESITDDAELNGTRWPNAAWGRSGVRRQVDASIWPVQRARPHLMDFLRFEPALLSARATAGFLSRAARGNLRISPQLIHEATAHYDRMVEERQVALAMT